MNEIFDIRSALNLSQAELAKVLGVDRSTITRWENGTASPRPLTMLGLREMLRRKRSKKTAAA